MKKTLIFGLLLINIPADTIAAMTFDQPTLAIETEIDSISLQNPLLVIREYLSQNIYLKPLLLLKEKEEAYLISNLKVPFLETIILLNTCLNNYKEAYYYESLLLEHFSSRNRLRDKNSNEIFSAAVDSLKMVQAKEIIVDIGRDRQVIMVNEEHRHPLHRSFLSELLPGLYKSGFRYLAAETLTSTDSMLNDRGYPIQESGFYTSDPVYGNTLRLAKNLGFTIVSYEYEGEYPEESSPEQEQEIREKGQAQNLIDKILKNDPKGKIIVFAGRAHIAEATTPNFSFMAWHFKELSGIDPFTIDQVQLSERHHFADEKPLYRYIINKLNPSEPVTFLYDDGNPWSDSGSYDMSVLHPETTYIKGRPLWLYQSSFRKPVSIRTRKLDLKINKNRFEGNRPVVLQVFKVGDTRDAVPVDQVMLVPGAEFPVLLLPEGTMRIEAKDEDGKVLQSYIEEV